MQSPCDNLIAHISSLFIKLCHFRCAKMPGCTRTNLGSSHLCRFMTLNLQITSISVPDCNTIKVQRGVYISKALYVCLTFLVMNASVLQSTLFSWLVLTYSSLCSKCVVSRLPLLPFCLFLSSLCSAAGRRSNLSARLSQCHLRVSGADHHTASRSHL